mgnify:CR=1 FL=1
MPWLVQLIEGSASSTADLNDGTNTFLNVSGFEAPPPPERMSFGGANLFRHGEDLIERRYGNRTVTVGFQMKGGDATALGTLVGSLWTMLRKAEEFQRQGLGTLVQLKYQWTGAPSPVYFNVIKGRLDLGADLHSPYLLLGTRIHNAHLDLLCEPFAVGTAETLENYLADPSFEIAGSALADWTADDGTGTGVRTTAFSKYGTASLELRRTAGTATNRRYQETTAFTGSDNISASVWTRPQAMTSGMVAIMRLTYLNTGGTVLGSSTATSSAAGTAFVQLTVSSITGSANLGTIRYELLLSGGTGTGTVQMDAAGLWKASAVPVAWVSGRDVRNHFDDNGQAHINYLDVYGVPGDVLAPLQIKASEKEAHTDFWVGARHAARQQNASLFLEAESFGTWGSLVVDSTASKGTVARERMAVTFQAVTSALGALSTIGTFTLDAGTGTNRVLVVGLAIHGTDRPGSSVTFGGTALTLQTTAVQTTSGAGGSGCRAELWTLKTPPTGTGTGTVTFTSTGTQVIGAMVLYNVDQGRFIQATGTGLGSGTVLVSVTTTAGNLLAIVGATTSSSPLNPTGTPAPTTRWDAAGALVSGCGANSIATGTSGTLGMAATVGFGAVLVASFYPFMATVSDPIVRTLAITTAPEGLYRVLSRINNPEGRDLQFSVGYSYGGITLTPTASSDFLALGTGTGFRIRDIGGLTIPPIKAPIGATVGTFTPRLAFYMGTPGGSLDVDVDWIMLMPVDQGFAYANKTSAQDRVMADSRSLPQAIYLLNTSDVLQTIPANQVGAPPETHPQGSRFYMVSDDGTAGIADGWTVSLTYLPRFLQVATA